jgi:hypothetical protein
MCSRARRWDVAVCASGSTSAHVYEAIAWPAFMSASNPVVMPPHISTRWIGLWGRWYLGMVAREECVEPSLGEGLGGLGGPLLGVCGGKVAEQTGMGLVGQAEGGGPPLLVVCAGRIEFAPASFGRRCVWQGQGPG